MSVASGPPATGASPGMRQGGVVGRGELTAGLERRLAASRATGAAVAVMLVEVVGLERIDSALGHAASDDALAALHRQLHARAAAGDLLGALPGRRVAWCRQGAARHEVAQLAEEAIDVVRAARLIDGARVRLAAHVGVAVAEGGRGSAAELLRECEIALLDARRRGANRYALFRRSARERIVRRVRLEEDLARALEEDELRLHFQPIVALDHGELYALEALVRWRHPRHGMVPPSQFIPIAEESGLIVDLGAWLLGSVCRHVARWRAEGPGERWPPVSVNISAREVDEGTLPRRLAAALDDSAVPPSAVMVEITESSAMTTGEGPVETLDALKRLGVQILLDDFGTGHSSLAQLARLPVDGIKLDRMFLNDLAAVTDPVPILRAVADMAHTLGIATVAEGIESGRQLTMTRRAGLDAAQGYLMARPAPAPGADELRALLDGARAAVAAHPGPAAPAGAGELVTLGAAAEIVGVSASTLRRLADRGELPARRTEGGHRRFAREELARYARERLGQRPRLRPRDLPTQALVLAAGAFADHGARLADQAGSAIYMTLHPGWFASPQGHARAGVWSDAFAAALRAGRYRDGVEVTLALLDVALLAGASPAECVRFVNQLTAAAVRELAQAPGADREARELHRLMLAVTEAFLDRLRRY